MFSMGDVVKLRKWRRARDEAAATAQAEANRRAFGRTTAEKQRDATRKTQRDSLLDAAKLDEPEA